MAGVYSCDFRVLPWLLQNAAAYQNVGGFTGWCSHDTDPAMKGSVSLEYALGVLHQQNRVKLLEKTLSTLAEQWRKNPLAVISRSVALVIPEKALSKTADALIGASRNNI